MADHQFAANIRREFETLVQFSAEACIYKAPAHLRVVNEECYRPYVVSIGPLYYKHPPLEDMQDCKMWCLMFFLEHDSNSHRSDLEHYSTILRELEGSIRNCYSVSVDLPSDVFIGMLLADSAFIICLFMRYHPILSSLPNEYDMVKRSHTWGTKLTRDLFLEENQIPLFVLDRLFREAFGESYPDISFIDLACTFISKCAIPVVNQHVNAATATERIKNGPVIVHLVDLLRNFCFMPTLPPDILSQLIALQHYCPIVNFPSNISQLRDAGVKFVPSKSANLLDITFSKGVLKIPPFKLWHTSEAYFRSMILFEQSHQPLFNKSYFIEYMILLENLIKTPKDVQILVQSGIIDNGIGSEKMASRLFNRITTHIDFPYTFCYNDLCKDLNAYANTSWNQWKAFLKRNYFSQPWAIVSLIYAFMILILAIAQTIGTFTKK